MFFLVTHILIGKYYPSLFTQFIIGCTCYILSFLIIKDVITDINFESCKYYVLALFAMDASFMIYKIKSNNSQNIDNPQIFDNINKPHDQKNSDAKSDATNNSYDDSNVLNQYEPSRPRGAEAGLGASVRGPSLHSVTLSSEINDIKITHDLSLPDDVNTLFSTSDEKSDEIVKNNFATDNSMTSDGNTSEQYYNLSANNLENETSTMSKN